MGGEQPQRSGWAQASACSAAACVVCLVAPYGRHVARRAVTPRGGAARRRGVRGGASDRLASLPTAAPATPRHATPFSRPHSLPRRAGLLEPAGEALERALSLDADAPDVWAELGLTMAAMGGADAEAAAKVCQKNVLRLTAASAAGGERADDIDRAR